MNDDGEFIQPKIIVVIFNSIHANRYGKNYKYVASKTLRIYIFIREDKILVPLIKHILRTVDCEIWYR